MRLRGGLDKAKGVSVRKGSGPIWTFDWRVPSPANVQIGPDPLRTLTNYGDQRCIVATPR